MSVDELLKQLLLEIQACRAILRGEKLQEAEK